jgi:hypothetical protein
MLIIIENKRFRQSSRVLAKSLFSNLPVCLEGQDRMLGIRARKRMHRVTVLENR